MSVGPKKDLRASCPPPAASSPLPPPPPPPPPPSPSPNYLAELAHERAIISHYAPYIAQEARAAARAKADEAIEIPRWLDYDRCTAVRFESREKLKRYRPETLAQASRIPGVNPADVAILAIIIKRGHH